VTSGRGPRICLIAIFLALIGVVAPSQVLLEWRAGDTPQLADLFRRKPTHANLRRLENGLESRCRLARAVRPWVQYARFVAFQDAGDKALLGRSGWLFYRPAVQYLVEPVRSVPARAYPESASGGTPKRSLRVDSGIGAKPSPRPAALTMPPGAENRHDVFAAIVSFRDDLAKRGIRLLVMPAPNKSSVCPERLCARAADEPGSVNPTTRAVLAQLQAAGVEVVDLFDIYGRCREAQGAGCYLAQDSHWSPLGLELAADVVARRLLDADWVRQGPVRYETKPVTIQRYGDVLRMMRVPQVERLYEPERIECTQVLDSRTGKPYVDDPNSPVLVLGDSFLRIFERDEPGSGGFVAHLARHLGFALTSVINDGGASTLVRQQLARKPSLLAGKKVVIWEFVERDIRFGTEGWQVIPLP